MFNIKDFTEYMYLDSIVGKDLLVWSKEGGYHFLKVGSELGNVYIVATR